MIADSISSKLPQLQASRCQCLACLMKALVLILTYLIVLTELSAPSIKKGAVTKELSASFTASPETGP